MNKLDFASINARLDANRLVPSWLPDGKKQGPEWVARNPTRNDKTAGSFSINLHDGTWGDFATGDEGGDLISLYAYLFHSNDNIKAARELAGQYGIEIDADARKEAADKIAKKNEGKPKVVMPVPADAAKPNFNHFQHGEPSAVWPYYNGKGDLLMFVCRFDHEDGGKDIVPLSWCDHPGKPSRWTWRGVTGSKQRPLYGQDRLTARPDLPVIVVEGEKSADAAHDLVGDHFVVVAWLGGTATADRINLTPLKGHRVILWPDFDAKRHKEGHEQAGELKPIHEQPGMKAMLAIYKQLRAMGCEVLMVGYDPAGQFADGWDLADAKDAGWKTENVMQFIELHADSPPNLKFDLGPTSKQPSLSHANDNNFCQDIHDLSPVDQFSWPHQSDKLRPLNTIPNLAHMLDHYGVTVRYDVIRKELVITHPGQKGTLDNQRQSAVNNIYSLCALNHLPKTDTTAFLVNIGDDKPINPVMDWITSRTWDGESRLQDLADTLTTEPGYDRGLAYLLLKRWLVSAIAAAALPSGFRSKGVLTLQGNQSVGKTAWFKSLVPEAQRDLLKLDALIDTRDKDTITSAVSHWIVELGELDATFRKSDIARLKGFISADYDLFRRPYARSEEKYPRKTVFFASVNDRAFLVDDTGNSRWWTLPVTKIDYEHQLDMQQVWAEVLELYRNNERWWLSVEEERALEAANAEHCQSSPLEELLLARYDRERPAIYKYTATEVLIELGYDRPTKSARNEAAKLLRKHFGQPRKTGGNLKYQLPAIQYQTT